MSYRNFKTNSSSNNNKENPFYFCNIKSIILNIQVALMVVIINQHKINFHYSSNSIIITNNNNNNNSFNN